ncbi:MAG: NUDIX domain-containing protein [Bacillota bacterium]
MEIPVWEAAGCVVLDRFDGKECVLLIWDPPYPDPTLPKGRLEPGETAQEAAVREVREETGYHVEIVDARPVCVERLLDRHPPVVLERIHFFLAKPAGEDHFPHPAPGENKIARWVPVDLAMSMIERKQDLGVLKELALRRGG